MSEIYPVHCVLCRWQCTICDSIHIRLPHGTVAHKRYTLLIMAPLCEGYIREEDRSYRTMVDGLVYHEDSWIKEAADECGEPITIKGKEGEPEGRQPAMAHSTLHRWISWWASIKARLTRIARITASDIWMKYVSKLHLSPLKYTTEKRKNELRNGLLVLCMRGKLWREMDFTNLGTWAGAP